MHEVDREALQVVRRDIWDYRRREGRDAAIVLDALSGKSQEGGKDDEAKRFGGVGFRGCLGHGC